MMVAATTTVPSSMNQIVEGPLPDGLLCRRTVCMSHTLILLHRRQLSFGRSGLERTGRRVLHGNRKNRDRGVRRDGVECGEISASSERRRLTSILFQERARQAGGKQYRVRRGGWRGKNGNLAQVPQSVRVPDEGAATEYLYRWRDYRSPYYIPRTRKVNKSSL